MTADAVALITTYNDGRAKSRLALKYKAMRDNPFSFLRGTAHLFHQRLRETGVDSGGPGAWISGDLHLENFGTYLGNNGLTYFDVNDFDECALAPCSWDLLRLVTSILVAAPAYKLQRSDAVALAGEAIERYRSELAGGKPRWIERRTADGAIGDLIDGLKHRDAAKFVLKRTVGKRGDKLDTASDKMEAVTNTTERKAVTTFVSGLAPQAGGTAHHKVLDVAYRIAGTGSLGIPRYVVLVEQTGADGKPAKALLDLKFSLPSSVAPASKLAQPDLGSEAQRIVTVQTLAQAIPPHLLQAVSVGAKPFVLKELQPSADRLDLATLAADKARITQAIGTMAALAAWAHLRTAGRHGAPSADDLVAFAQAKSALKPVLPAARAMEKSTLDDWATFCKAYDAGAFADVLAAIDKTKADEAA